MYSSLPKYRDLLVLYVATFLTLITFGLAYTYANKHGWNHVVSTSLCLILGVITALLVWAGIEKRLQDGPRQLRINISAAASSDASFLTSSNDMNKATPVGSTVMSRAA